MPCEHHLPAFWAHHGEEIASNGLLQERLGLVLWVHSVSLLSLRSLTSLLVLSPLLFHVGLLVQAQTVDVETTTRI